MQPIRTTDAPVPNGHYEQAIVHSGLAFVSTQLPIDPNSGSLVQSDIVAQAQQVLGNILAIVQASGSDIDHIVRMTIYVSDVDHWPAVNEVYESFFGDAKPARGVIPTGKLHLGADVAADCIAAVPEKPNS